MHVQILIPVITITSAEDVIRSDRSGFSIFTLNGTVADADSDIVRVSATIDGNKKTVVVNATPEGVQWSLTWDIAADDIAQSTYNSIEVAGDDGFGGQVSTNWEYILYVDKTGPQPPQINANTNWTNAESVAVTIADTTDTGAGISYTEYMLSGATVSGWIRNTVEWIFYL